MTLEKLNRALTAEINQLTNRGSAKPKERVIVGYIPGKETRGERYKIEGSEKEFIRMNANGYLSLSTNADMIAATDEATHQFGVGPGAVRFIDGTFQYHIALEKRIAEFTSLPAAKIFNSAYTSNLSLSLVLSGEHTYWIGDELNHNSIIRSMRIANVPKTNRSIYKHNDMESLRHCLDSVPENIKRVCVIFDGIFSMRGDFAPMDAIKQICDEYHDRFEDGVITIVDDSHGIGAYGETGRGTCEHTNTQADIIVGTFGKAFGVNGGFIAGSSELIEAVRQKADTYIYTNPLSVADCAATIQSIDIVDSKQGHGLIKHVQSLTHRFRTGIKKLGYESIDGPHPIVPIYTRDTAKTQRTVQALFEHGVLAVGIIFPVVPKGSETIRIQINAGLTDADIDYVLTCLDKINTR